MILSNKSIREYKEIFKNEFGQNLTDTAPKLEIYKFPFENETSLLSEIINLD